MVKQGKIWCFRRNAGGLRQPAAGFAASLDLSPVTAGILLNRGITDSSDARRFLFPEPGEIGDPYLLLGMDVAVRRIRRAVDRREKIWIYGDYDVDGVTSTALLMLVLTRLGANVGYYIPSRLEEGYGLNPGAITEAAQSGVELIITVDCGIAAVDEVEFAASLGIEIIVTDHHEPFNQLPAALAVINPKQKGCSYPCKNLAGVGVAFKLAQALLDGEPDGADRYLDLAALGTVADIVPLTGENRAIVRFGIQALNETQNIGLLALLDMVGFANRPVDAEKIAFLIAPRINATGRVGDAKRSVELFLTDDPEQARELALILDKENRERQAIEGIIFGQALELLGQDVDLEKDKVIVLASPGWHIGVIGIVASRIAELHTRPTILISIEGDEGKGSARSIPGFNLFAALEACSPWLRRFGGHAQAAGLGISPECIEAFRLQINAVAADRINAEDMLPVHEIDCEISLTEITPELWEQLVRLNPYGSGNPNPTFLCRRTSIIEGRRVGGKGEHLKLRVGQNSLTFDVIGFGQGYLWDSIANRERVDLVFSLENNLWNGRESLQLVLKDLKNSQLEDNLSLRWDERIWVDDFMNNDSATRRKANILPRVTDHRGAKDKLQVVLEEVAAGSGTLIYVNTREQAIALALSLKQCLPEGKEQIAISHSRMDKARQGKVWARLQAGQIRVLVTAGVPADAERVSGLRHLILYYPPYRESTFLSLIQLAFGSPEPCGLHLLYTNRDIAGNQALLQHLVPERNVLAHLYLMLRQMKKGEGPIALDSSEIANHFGLLGEPRLHTHTVSVGLEIFSEMGLVRCTCEDGQQLIYLPAPPRQKIDLEASEHYAVRKQGRDDAVRFQDFLLQATTHDLLNLITSQKA